MTWVPRFSIKTLLFVVAIVAVATAYVVTQLSWIAERKRAIAWMHETDSYWAELPGDFRPDLDNSAPWRIRMFGASGVRRACVIVYSERTIRARTDQLKRLFPEADIEVIQLGESPGATVFPPWNSGSRYNTLHTEPRAARIFLFACLSPRPGES
ncbi:hypothetical protein Poly59_31170 [Rubripirellula reticaptiva]|uniref:Uncharacterized protein n=1 Tax=Rubripirellula reticaptiva TaxID=2528013 RepID=A0A5C6ES95_9BACT|nr:hypothetical protein Poly59_31170 [Rubripirellula reticaptiva]